MYVSSGDGGQTLVITSLISGDLEQRTVLPHPAPEHREINGQVCHTFF